MKVNKAVFAGMLFVMILSNVAGLNAQEDAVLYNHARQAVLSGEIDFAFNYFYSLLQYSASSRYYQDAVFACGEYYFLNNDYYVSSKMFTDFIKACPQSEAFPFAIVYLKKMAASLEEANAAYDFKKNIIKFKQLSLLFSEFKEYEYVSPLGLKYKALYYIDRAEFYINGELFEKVYF
ncbi:MAG: hypothetical protein HY810_01225 [Candidatus Omnitrophica bacterium]|nr:hypothetical protein [Candidatus Omnitrophota bacterium]